MSISKNTIHKQINQGLLLLVILFFMLSGFSQSSAKNIEIIASKQMKLDDAIEQLDACLATAEYSKGKDLIERSLKSYLLSKDHTLKAKFAFQAGDIYHYLSKFQLSVQYFKESYHHYAKIHDFANMAEAQIGLMETYKFLKNYQLSLKYGYKAIATLDSIGKIDEAMYAKTLLCKPLIEFGDLVTAEKFLKKLLVYFTKNRNEESLASVWEHLAFLDLRKSKFEQALTSSNKALHNYRKIKDVDGEITIYLLQSEIYLQLKQFEKALYFAEKANILIEKSEDKRGLHKGHLVIATTYLKMRQYDRAISHLRTFEKIGKAIEDPRIELQTQLFMLKWFREKQDWKSALQASEKYQSLQDSINKSEEQEFMTAMSVRYEMSEKEKDLQQVRKNALLQKANRNLIISILIASIIILMLILNRYRLAQRKNQELYEQELAANKQKLDHFTQHILEKNKLIQSFEIQFHELTQLNESQETERTEKLNQLYHQKILTDEDWINFQRLYREVYPHFIEKLKNIDENLSEGDIRHLLLVKLNMSTREISEVLGISINSVRVGRHRLRKRLNIDEDTDLRDILSIM